MDQKWFEDMMSQTYNEDICFNPSKLLLLHFISKEGNIISSYKIKDFQEYLFRVYIDNPDVSSKHPSYIIRNLGVYGAKDLYEHILDTLESWRRDAKNGILKYNDNYFGLQVSLEDGIDIAKNTMRLAKLQYKKIYAGNIPEPKDISETILKMDDHSIPVFGKSAFRNRVFEDIQYCPICESINKNDLYCVHIYEERMGATNEELVDKNNGLLLCYKHADDFVNNRFYFDELGFAHEIVDALIDPGVHLSFSVRNSSRKQFLQKRVIYLKQKGFIK